MLQQPTPEEIKLVRKSAGITQKVAGELVYVSCRAFQKWEAPIDKGNCKMPMAAWELFNAKVGNIKIEVFENKDL